MKPEPRRLAIVVGLAVAWSCWTAPPLAAQGPPGQPLRLKHGAVDPSQFPPFRGGPGTGRRHTLLRFDSLLRPIERETLRARGVHILQYLPDSAYWAAVDESADVFALREGGGVRGAWLVPSRYRTSPRLAGGPPARPLGRSASSDGSIRVVAVFFSDVTMDEARAAVAGVAGASFERVVSSRAALVRVSRASLNALAELDLVEWIEPEPAPVRAHNAVAAGRSHVDSLWAAPYGLTGQGVRVGVWDEGSIGAHGDFDTRLSLDEPWSPVSSHSTHVAGTIAGSGAGNSSARGMASRAELWSWDWSGDTDEMQAAPSMRGVRISSHSYGEVAGWESEGGEWVDYGPDAFGLYDWVAAVWDYIVAATGLLPFKSAGNDRDDGPDYPGGPRRDGPYDTIVTYGVAKNVVTLCATSDSDAMTSFSGWGPADDGRVKPDLCANGTGLLSTLPGGAYGSMTGTSMATPVAAGAAALLFEALVAETGSEPAPHTVKGIMIHGARDLGNPGPDYESGWGLLDARESADLVRAGAWSAGTVTATGGEARYSIAVPAGAAKLQVTLAWTDPEGDPAAAIALVNDLDLSLTGPGGTTALPWVLDGANPANPAARGVNHVDNVEQVVVTAPSEGAWTVVVHGTAVPMGPQAFSVVASGIVPVPPAAATQAASGVSAAGATLNGTVNPGGTAATAYFEYGPTSSYGSLTPAQAVGAGTGDASLQAAIEGLGCGTEFRYRIVGVNAGGASYGSDRVFTTAACPPAATTLPATGVTTSGATLVGAANPRGAATSARFEYGPTSSYGAQTPPQDVGSGTGEVPVPAAISGLACGTTYHYRLVVSSAGGAAYGSDATLRTRSCPADFGGDGKSDILWHHGVTGSVYLWPMNGAAVLSQSHVGTVADTNWEIKGFGDQTGDRKADILWRNKATGRIYLWPMDGTTKLSETPVGTVATVYEIVGFGDYDGDGKADILWRHKATGDVWIWLMDGPTKLSQNFLGTVDTAYQIVGSGDFDGDRKADILWRHQTAGAVWIWLMDGATPLAFSQHYVATVEPVYAIVRPADFDGDARADVLWRHTATGDIRIWLMGGATPLSQSYVGVVNDLNWEIVAAGDYDGNGKADLLWRHKLTGSVYEWPMDGAAVLAQTPVGIVPDTNWKVVNVR